MLFITSDVFVIMPRWRVTLAPPGCVKHVSLTIQAEFPRINKNDADYVTYRTYETLLKRDYA